MAKPASVKLNLDASFLPSDFRSVSPLPISAFPLLRHLHTPSPLSKPHSPLPPRDSPYGGRTTPLGKLTYRPVYIRTYKLSRKESPPSPVHPTANSSLKVFKCYWNTLPYNEGRPEVREGAAMSECCGSLYLYGGLSKSVYNDIYVLRQDSDSWEPVETMGVASDARYGHTLVEQGANMVLFGGALKADSKRQIRECFNTIRLLEPLGYTRVLWKPITTIGPVIEMRRYHATAIVGHQMMVIGGLSQKNKVLDDCVVLDLETGMWELKSLTTGSVAICCHTAVTVVETYVQLRGVNDPKLCESSPELKQRGIYIFGGMNSQGNCSNGLRGIWPGVSGLESRPIDTSGKSPAPRCQHSMVFSRVANVIVIFGGKMPETKQNTAAVYKDLHVLDLTNLHWSQVIVSGHTPRARWAHSCGTLQDKIVLFGGIEVNQFSTNETFILTISATCSSPLPVQTLPTIPSTRTKSAGRMKIKHRTYLM